MNFSSNDAANSTYDKLVQQPLQQLIYDYTKNQLAFDMYYSSTLASQGSCLDSIIEGTVDIGFDILSLYNGTYLYNELINTPGIDYGTSENYTRLVNEYTELFHDAALDSFCIVARFCSGTFGFLTVDKPVAAFGDLKGMSLRATGNFIPYLENMGASGSFLPISELYEAIRLNVVDGAQATLASVIAFKFYEVCNCFTPITWFMGDQVIAMSGEVYKSMPSDIQDGIDKASDDMLIVGINYSVEAYQEAKDTIEQYNPNFHMLKFLTNRGPLTPHPDCLMRKLLFSTLQALTELVLLSGCAPMRRNMFRRIVSGLIILFNNERCTHICAPLLFSEESYCRKHIFFVNNKSSAVIVLFDYKLEPLFKHSAKKGPAILYFIILY